MTEKGSGARSAHALFQQARAALQAGQLAEAVRWGQQCLRRHPDHLGALQLSIAALGGLGQVDQAVQLGRRAVKAHPREPALRLNLATALGRQGRHEEAILAAREAVRLAPRNPKPRLYLASAQRDAGQLANAVGTVRSAHALVPDNPGVVARCADVLISAGEWVEAASMLGPVLREETEAAPAWSQAARLALEQQDLALARDHAQKARELVPAEGRAWSIECSALEQQGAVEELAERVREAAQALGAADPVVAHWRGVLAARQGDDRAAARYWNQALAADPTFTPAAARLSSLTLQYDDARAAERFAAIGLRHAPLDGGLNRAMVVALERQGRGDEATRWLSHYRRRQPADHQARDAAVYLHLRLCNWRALDEVLGEFRAALDAGESPDPSTHNAHSVLALPVESPVQNQVLGAVSEEVRRRVGAVRPLELPAAPDDGVLRVGYISPDIREHPTLHLGGHVFGMHDRDRVTVHVYSVGPSGESPRRERVKQEADVFRDLYGVPDDKADALIRGDRLHVLVDAGGYTTYSRPELLARRPAPVQIGWMVYAGSTRSDWLDYYLGDATVTPPEIAEAQFTEQVITLPGCYLPTDNAQTIGPAGARSDHGLPTHGVVFACFNNHYKISADVFARWMRILQAVPGSVLWLLEPQALVVEHLRNAAMEAGVDPDRLIFAPRVDKPAHLGRHRHADLFLDTPWYNAHTTGVDALWAGLPLLSVAGGDSLARRVGASLLENVGLPELVMPDWDAYEAEAIALARDPDRLIRLRTRLESGLTDSALFNSSHYVRALEWAYHEAWARFSAGERPASFVVPPEV